MTLLQPSSCTCYHLKPPHLPNSPEYTSLNQYTKKKLALECRTGAAVNLSRSNLFVHGGLTVPLDIENINILQLQKELIIYFSKINDNRIDFENLTQWISSETFFLDLVSRTWYHVETGVEEHPENSLETGLLDHDKSRSSVECSLRGRIFHSMCYFDSALYIFGGLIVSPQSGYELIATNELWKLDLRTKKWKLISNDPKITRRFNHSMHLKNENVDTRDTKLIIVGGVNNINESVISIDVYNLSQNCWQDDAVPNEPLHLKTNIDADPIALSAERNFTILVENNEAKIPALVVYKPNNQVEIESDDPLKKRKKNKEDLFNKDKIISPMATLPLMSNSKGMRLAYNNLQTVDTLRESFNLQFPSGQYFGYNIIIGGFYPNFKASNFYCFVYDITSGRWTRVSIVCSDIDINKHRFWKLFVWKSHHQTLLLGTNKDDGHLPSVQKFDHILSFGLPLINAFNKIISPPHASNLQKRKQSLYSTNSFQTNLEDTIQQQLVFENEEPLRSSSYASSVTSQFESYIRYIAPSIELTSIRSAFPPYAMVLGKDALDIYGDSFADFEFVTSEGDIVGVPMYLIRQRWGRYFDFLLSQGYSKICLESETNMKRSTLVNNASMSSVMTSRASSRQDLVDYFRDSTRSSISRHSGKASSYTQLEKINSEPQKTLSQINSQILESNTEESSNPEKDRGKFPPPLKNRLGPTTYLQPPEESYDINDPVSPPPNDDTFSNKSENNPIRRTGTTSTTSSSTGMVFRVPFQENNPSSLRKETAVTKDGQQRRRSSFMDIVMNPSDEIEDTKINSQRRASHPIQSLNVKFNSDNINSTCNNNNNKGSKSYFNAPSSTSSSVSYVSSSSERKRNSLPSLGHGSISSASGLEVLNVNLPPRTNSPNEPVPDIPTPKVPNMRPSASIYNFSTSNRGSPFSSRRASYVSASSNQDWRNIPSSLNNTSNLDETLLEQNEEINGEKHSSIHSPSINRFKPYYSRKESSSRDNSSSKIPTLSDKTRLSVVSKSDSMESRSSIAGHDFEPLLIPRSLYLPWPTSSIKALSEYFYTGQANSKWLLAPVALDLLLMSKLYEIPLLYSLISEMLYSILGRKEEGLFVTCTSLRNGFVLQVKRYFNSDETKIEQYLASSECYKELLKLHKALIEIDNGFLNYELLKKSGRTHSVSTHESSGSDELDKGFRRAVSTGSFAHYKDSIVSFGSRGSRESLGSLSFPLKPNFQDQKLSMGALSPRVKKKSSLSREINPFSLYLDEDIDTDKSKNKYKRSTDYSETDVLKNASIAKDPEYYLNLNLTISSDETSSETDSDFDGDEGEEPNFQRFKSNPETTSLSTIVDARTNAEEVEADFDKNMKQLNTAPSKTKISKSLLSDYMDSGLGMASLSKMKKKVQKAEEDYDESIDPLFKINSALHSPGRPQGLLGRSSITSSTFGAGTGVKLPREGLWNEDYSILRLECIASPNALPPVDYIIKFIYKTAVLVNDIKMTIRCLDCLEISKGLKHVKKSLLEEVSKMENEMKTKTKTKVAERKESVSQIKTSKK